MNWQLRPLDPRDRDALIAVYRDAVLSQTPGLYNPEQVRAWAGHADAGVGAYVLAGLERGYGLASLGASETSTSKTITSKTTIEAFGLLDPPAGDRCRLALLYCRGRASRQGRASAILAGLELWARQRGCLQLHTEASQLSRPLLERRGWRVEREERLVFAGEPFVRWRMIKDLS
jgi:GNAT superfamily N-acetyltransferase